MDFQIKLFRWPHRGNHVIGISRGPLDPEGFKEIFREVDQITEPLSGCRVVIDLRDSTYLLESTDIPDLLKDIVENVSPRDNKLALVSAPEVKYSKQLAVLSGCLSNHDFNIAVFTDMSRAASWLTSASLV
jgi:hypothetical protein